MGAHRDAVANLGIPFGYMWWGLAAAVSEGIGGLLFASGLLFRPASLALAGVMRVATFERYARPEPMPEHPLKNLFLFVGMFLAGPGMYSLDYLRSQRESWRARHASRLSAP